MHIEDINVTLEHHHTSIQIKHIKKMTATNRRSVEQEKNRQVTRQYLLRLILTQNR